MKQALILILLATAGITATASPVDAHGRHHREVTHGHFETLPGGAELGYHVHGRAKMVRSDRHGGVTKVVVRVRGLDPDTTYPAHVHNQPCSATPPGGSHYQHVIGGAVDRSTRSGRRSRPTTEGAAPGSRCTESGPATTPARSSSTTHPTRRSGWPASTCHEDHVMTTVASGRGWRAIATPCSDPAGTVPAAPT